MKIKKAFDICKRDNNIATYSITDGELWLTNGVAAWALNDVPELSEDYICQLYDINDKKREKIHFHINMEVPEHLNLNDADPKEFPAEPLTTNLVLQGKGIVQPLLWERGLVLIEKQYLEPLSDYQEEDISYWIRYADAEAVYVAVKVGLLLYAIIVPTKPTDSNLTDIVSLYAAAKMD